MPERSRSRRAVLGLLGAGLLGGCLGAPTGDPLTPTETERTRSTPSATPTPTTRRPTRTPTPTATATPVPPSYDRSVTHPVDPFSEWSPPSVPPSTAVEPVTVVENLEIPWDLAFAPDGEMFISERTGRILRYAGEEVESVATPGAVIDAGSVPADQRSTTWVVEGGEGGLLGIDLHPQYPAVPLLYAAYTYDGEDGRYNRLSTFDVSAADPGETERTLIEEIPASTFHNGSRVAFGPRNYLWVTTGDARDGSLARDPNSLAGSVLRLEPDGTAPPDNPPVGDPRVYTYGHRNPQGIAWLPDGRPLVTEHGPSGFDEVNVLEPGGDYGWPVARRPGEYAAGDFHPPVLSTGKNDSWAPAGCVFYTGDAVGAWQNRLVVATLGGQRLQVVTLVEGGPDRSAPAGVGQRYEADWLDDSLVAASRAMLVDVIGRVRHVAQGPGGELYAVTSNRDGRSGPEFPRKGDDRLVRIVPTA